MDLKDKVKEQYIKKEDRKKILLLGDDLRGHSGVGIISREIVFNTGNRYNWVQMAGSLKHPDEGKIFDISRNVNENLGIEDGSVKLYPITGYGDLKTLRAIVEFEKPDAIMLVTDPRYYDWLFVAENEIRTKIPIIYLNIWDNLPIPYYNKQFYQSCDLLLGISKQTKYINDTVLGKDKRNTITEYLPHGLNTNEIFPIDKSEPNLKKYKERLLGGDDIDFILFFNSRNLKRKQVSDTILSYKYFLDKIPTDKALRTRLLMHTEESSPYGTDLNEVANLLLGDKYRHLCIIHEDMVSREEINYMYNISDVKILLSSNEGWGLGLTEALLSATPFIANVTGGMQDQMGFQTNDGMEYFPTDEVPSNSSGRYLKCGNWAFPAYPSVSTLQGSPKTPYIFEDIVSPKHVSSLILNTYNDREKLEQWGREGYEWATSNKVGYTSNHQALKFMSYVDNLFETWIPRERYTITNLTKYEKPRFTGV